MGDDKGVVRRILSCWPMLSSGLEGPPGACHVGCVASIIDDACGAFTNTRLRSQGKSGEVVTAYLHVDYKAPTPLTEVVCVVTLDGRSEGRKVFAKAALYGRKG